MNTCKYCKNKTARSELPVRSLGKPGLDMLNNMCRNCISREYEKVKKIKNPSTRS
jgi:hypothetical protein